MEILLASYGENFRGGQILALVVDYRGIHHRNRDHQPRVSSKCQAETHCLWLLRLHLLWKGRWAVACTCSNTPTHLSPRSRSASAPQCSKQARIKDHHPHIWVLQQMVVIYKLLW